MDVSGCRHWSYELVSVLPNRHGQDGRRFDNNNAGVVQATTSKHERVNKRDHGFSANEVAVHEEHLVVSHLKGRSIMLFRPQAVDSPNDRLVGHVIITQPLSHGAITYFLAGIVAVAILWVTTATYARTETSRGILTTNVASSEIISPAAGIIAELRVVEGQHVRAGQVVGVINLERRDAKGTAVSAGAVQSIDERVELAQQRVEIVRERESQERRRLAGVVGIFQRRIAALRSQIGTRSAVVASQRGLVNELEPLTHNGFVSRVEFERRRQQWMTSAADLDALRSQLAALEGDLHAARMEAGSLATITAGTVNDLHTSLQSLTQQRLEQSGAGTYALVAPATGRITILQAGVGLAARANVPLMTVIPDQAVLQAEVYVPTKAVGFVRPGQEVRLLYDAFPYQRFGSAPGHIVSISRTPLNPQDSLAPIRSEEPVYKVIISLGSQQVRTPGRDVSLQPGMTLTANLVLERRTFLQWLLSPLNSVLNRQ